MQDIIHYRFDIVDIVNAIQLKMIEDTLSGMLIAYFDILNFCLGNILKSIIQSLLSIYLQPTYFSKGNSKYEPLSS